MDLKTYLVIIISSLISIQVAVLSPMFLVHAQSNESDFFANIDYKIFDGEKTSMVKFNAIIHGGTPPYEYQWQLDVGRTSIDASPEVEYPNGDTARVSLVIKDVTGKTTTSLTTFKIEQNDNPIFDFIRENGGILGIVVSGIGVYEFLTRIPKSIPKPPPNVQVQVTIEGGLSD